MNVRAEREARGWSQHDLAERANVSQGTVSRLERGLPVRASELAAIEAVLARPRSIQAPPLVCDWCGIEHRSPAKRLKCYRARARARERDA